MPELIEVLRIIFGSVYVLVVPGLAWTFVFFPKTKPFGLDREAPGIDWLERAALSFGLSIALVPLTVFFLSTFLKLRLTTTLAVLVIFVLTLSALAIILWRNKKGSTRFLRRLLRPGKTSPNIGHAGESFSRGPPPP